MSSAARVLTLLLSIIAWSIGEAGAPPASGHYLFAWAGDVAQRGNDFLAVIDADPGSAWYGDLLATAVTDQVSMQVHHTEYVMPEGGLLFANDHLAGRTFIFDVRDPLHPKVTTSFTELAGYVHPHSFLRLPNGHVLSTFQHMQHASGDPRMGSSGGLVEIDDRGHVIRAASSADPAFPVYFDTGGRRYGEIDPEEPRRGPDGSVYVQTLACGIERITDIATAGYLPSSVTTSFKAIALRMA